MKEKASIPESEKTSPREKAKKYIEKRIANVDQFFAGEDREDAVEHYRNLIDRIIMEDDKELVGKLIDREQALGDKTEQEERDLADAWIQREQKNAAEIPDAERETRQKEIQQEKQAVEKDERDNRARTFAAWRERETREIEQGL